MIRYYGLWQKKGNRWSELSWYKCNPDKKIGTTSLWLNKDKLLVEISRYYSKLYEIRMFTPADALLVKCGKMK